MQPPNHYQPPSAELLDQINQRTPTRGFSLAWGLFWRVLVFHTVVGLPVLLLFAGAGTAGDATLLKIKPTAFFAAFACLHLVAMRINARGALWLIWGKRLALTVEAWQRITWHFVVMYSVLAVLNLLVAFTAPVAIWVTYKAIVPFVGILAACTLASRMPKPKGRSATSAA